MKIKNIAVLSGKKTKVHDGVVHYVPEFKEKKQMMVNPQNLWNNLPR